MSSIAKTELGRFLGDVIWVGVAQTLIMAFGVISMPVLTKTYSTEMYGVWTQLLTTLTLIAPVINLQLGNAMVRFLAGETEKDKRVRYLGNMLGIILIFACLIYPALILMASRVSLLLFGSAKYVTFVYLIYIWTFIEAILYFFAAYFQARKRIKQISAIETFLVISRMAAIVILTRMGKNLEILVASVVVIEAAITIFLFLLIVRQDGLPRLNFGKTRQYLAFSLPMVPNPIMTWIMNSADRYLITYFIGLSYAGIYSSSYTLGTTISLFYAPISYVLLPTVSRAWDNNQMETVKTYFEYSVKLFLLIAIPATAALAIISQPILKILTTTNYLAGWGIVLIISVSSVLYGLFSLNVFAIYLVKKMKWLPWIFLFTSIISLGLNYLLIPRIGINGAATSRLIAYAVLAVVSTLWARRIVKYNIDFKCYLKILGATAIMAVFLYFMNPQNLLAIIEFAVAGTILFIVLLLLFRTFSEQERRFVHGLIKSSVPRFGGK
jgi:O-antigen/teichoic acid export membrane protein